MATITTLNSTDSGSTSRGTINTNFTNLNTDKAELASPTFTGTPTLPTGTIAVTQSAGDSSTKIATTAFVAAAAGVLTIETTSGTTHSLTTTAGQRVMVWAKCSVEGGTSGDITVTLAYNSVAKDTATGDDDNITANFKYPYALMYTETPGAATANITLSTSFGSIVQPVIMVLKIG